MTTNMLSVEQEQQSQISSSSSSSSSPSTMTTTIPTSTTTIKSTTTSTRSTTSVDIKHVNGSNGLGMVKKICINLNNKQKLKYRAEGNANLVLSLPDSKHVLRLRKSIKFNKQRNKLIINDDDDNDDNHDADRMLIKDSSSSQPFDECNELTLSLCIDYIKFISKLIGINYTNEPILVRLMLSDYEEFNRWLQINRPVERLDKNIQCQYGMLYPDVAFLPDSLLKGIKYHKDEIDTFCIEIKPKQGWTFSEFNDFGDITTDDYYWNDDNIYSPNTSSSASTSSSPHLSTSLSSLSSSPSSSSMSSLQGNDNVGIKKCRFCLMQYLKLEKKKISKISEYCPIDLFSGNINRMARSIFGLINTPQNNFRIFKNGKLIYKNDDADVNKFQQIANELFDVTATSSSASLNTPMMTSKLQTPNDIKLSFVNLLIKALLKDFSHVKQRKRDSTIPFDYMTNPSISDQLLSKRCQAQLFKNIPSNCILKKILNIQLLAKFPLMHPPVGNGIKIHNECSILNVDHDDDGDDDNNKDYQVDDDNGINPQQQRKSQQHEQYSYIIDILQKEKCFIKNIVDTKAIVKPSINGSLTADKQKLKYLNTTEKYLLGATALDCSIMLAFQRLPNTAINYDLNKLQQTHLITQYGQRFMVKVIAMDLDPKPKKHYSKYIRQTNASIIAYNNYCCNNQNNK